VAISGAADKLKRAIDSALGRLHDKKLHATPERWPMNPTK
jgi:hypothetical protein